jgi:hypothetical protein
LLAEKWSIEVFGNNEQALRLTSLLSGLLVIALTWDVARRTLGAPAAALATVLVAFSPALIRYSNEVKQYSTDAAAVLVLLDVVVILCASRDKRLSWGRGVFFGVLIAGACAMSQVAVMVSAVVLPTVLILLWSRNRLRGIAVVGAGLVGVCFQWATTIHYLADSQAHRLAVRWFYPPLLPMVPLGSRLHWLPGALGRLADDPFGASVPLLLCIAVGVCIVLGLRRRPWLVALLTCPLLLACLAVLDYRYPFGGRFALYLIPPILLLCVAVLVPVRDAATAERRAWSPFLRQPLALIAGGVVIGSLLVTEVPTSIRVLGTPTTITEIRPVLQQVKALRGPDEAVLTYTGTDTLYVYYARRLGGLPLTGRSIDEFPDACPDGPLFARLRTSHRFWFVYTVLDSSVAPGGLHDGDPGTPADLDRVIDRLSLYGKVVRRISGTRAGAVEFVMSAAPYRTPAPHTNCLVAWALPTSV